MSEFYANKEKRKQLADLSEKVFGTRSKYQYFVKERGYSITFIEQQMIVLADAIDKQMAEDQDGKNERPSGRVKRPNRAFRRKHNIR
jgi:hypothetical protein